MNFFMSDHCKLERVEGDTAIVTVRLPIRDLEAVSVLLDVLMYCARWLLWRSRAFSAIVSVRQMRWVSEGANGSKNKPKSG